MADHQPPEPSESGSSVTSGSAKMALVVYILYVLGAVLTGGLVTLIGLVIAYVNRGEAQGTWVESHFRWQIRTFWIGLLYSVIATVLLAIGVGAILYGLILVWLIVRVAMGWSHLAKERAVPNPTSWFF